MIITTGKNANQNNYQEPINITDIYKELSKSHRNIMITTIGDEIFICKSLSRLEFKEIKAREDLSLAEKEDVICALCTLWPEDYDFANCPIAGIPTTLAKEIIGNSGVNDVMMYHNIIEHFREEISTDIDAQIACIINEAFPNFDVEEIEKWDIEKTAKYLSRAEFILINLRSANEGIKDYITGMQMAEMPQPEGDEEDLNIDVDKIPERETNLKGGKKEKIDLQEMAKFQEQFPEFDVSQDAVMHEGIDALNVKTDTTPYVFRTGYEDE